MRVVSLLPAATDIAIALGAADWLVAVTHECDAAECASLPRVTRSAVNASAAAGVVDAEVRELSESGASLFALDEPTIAELAPDVILTQAVCDVCAVDERDVRALAQRLPKTPAVVTLSATTLDGVLTDIERVADALDIGSRGAMLADELRARMRRVHETLKTARAPRPRVAVIEWTDPLFAAGHWVPETIRRAGGVDVLAEPGAHSRVVSGVDVRQATPDIVLVAPCGYDVERAAAEAERLGAFGARELWALDGNALTSRPGPRVVDGIEVMASIFAPHLFAAPATHHARRVTPA